MRPGHTHDTALPRPRYEGLHGTTLCVACGFFGLGTEHPEWCSWEVLKERPLELSRALAVVELGERVAERLELPSGHELLPIA